MNEITCRWTAPFASLLLCFCYEFTNFYNTYIFFFLPNYTFKSSRAAAWGTIPFIPPILCPLYLPRRVVDEYCGHQHNRVWAHLSERICHSFIQQIFTGHLIYARAFLGTKAYSLGDRMANLLDKMTFEQGSENFPPTDG